MLETFFMLYQMAISFVSAAFGFVVKNNLSKMNCTNEEGDDILKTFLLIPYTFYNRKGSVSTFKECTVLCQ